jgi:N6-adenosine-specific RNA methylase IME4
VGFSFSEKETFRLTHKNNIFEPESETRSSRTTGENPEADLEGLGTKLDLGPGDPRDAAAPQDQCHLKFHPITDIIPEVAGKELADLISDIKEHGQVVPILKKGAMIIDGRARLRACRAAGFVPKYQEWDGQGSIIERVFSLNVMRRHLTLSQRAALAVDMQPMLEAAAAERKKATQAKRGTGKVGSVGTKLSPPESKGRSRDKVAKIFKVSAGSVATAKKIKDTNPDLRARVRAGDMTLQQAEHAIRRGEKESLAERIRQEPQPLPQGPYRVIVADPAWMYECDDLPYPTMTIQQIKELPVGALAHTDCVLWLWTTNTHLHVAFNVLGSWGFEYKNILTWAKDRMGHGEWLRNQSEHCLLATRGNPVFTAPGHTTLLNGPTREHSRKPETFYELVQATCPGSKVELFSRQERDGWVVWGAEKDLFAA